MAGLGKNFILKLRLVRAERIHRRHAPYRGVQIIEELIANASGNFGSVSPREHVLIRNDDAAGLAHRGRDRVSQSNGEGDRERSTISTEIPSRANCAAATSAR